MPDLTASIPHQLGRVEAKRRIQEQLGVLRQQHASLFTDLQENWTGDTMAFSICAMGQTVTGQMTVDEQMLHLAVNLPWLLKMMAAPIKHRLELEGKKLLALPAK